MRTWNNVPKSGAGKRNGNFSKEKSGAPGSTCICPRCGAAYPHTPGTPCVDTKCPACGTPMCRKY